VKRICVFCGSSAGADPRFVEAARAFGGLLAAEGIGLVFGGGSVGVMGEVADATMAAGGEVIGVIPEWLVGREVGHQGITELRVVGSMHERKAMMAELSDAFVALPGGLGTLEEICEILTWAQLELHAKPCGILNVAGYFDLFLGFLDHAVGERLLRPRHRALVLVEAEPAAMLSRLLRAIPRGEVPGSDEAIRAVT